MHRTFTWLVALVVAAGALWWFLAGDREHAVERSSPTDAASATASQMPAQTDDSRAGAPPSSRGVAEPAAPAATPWVDEPVAQSNDKVFRVDEAGRLILDQHTRLNLEALIARTPVAELEAAKKEAIAPLPAAAAAQAADLIDRYYEYDIAQRQTYPPGQAPSTEEEALAELDGLRALREAHFGPEVARAFYTEEEALNRELIELMKLEKDQSLTLAEKAERAQRARDTLPRVDAIERRNRNE
jgi:hypothetical protein